MRNIAPGSRAMAFRHGFAKQQLSVAIRKGGVERSLGLLAGLNVCVDCSVELLERIRESLGVARLDSWNRARLRRP